MSLLNFAKDAFSRVIEFNLGVAYLVRDTIFGAPESTPVESNPYTPPFTGGQCINSRYEVVVGINFVQNGVAGTTTNNIGRHNGRLVSLKSKQVAPNTWDIERITDPPTDNFYQFSWATGAGLTEHNITSITVTAVNGTPDNCGDLPNPNPPTPTSESGLANSPPPNIVGDGITVSEGLAPLPAAGALAAALAALRAALDLAAAVQAIADALQALKDLLKNKDDKDDKENVKIIQLNLGSISRDGFLRLYPSDNSAKYQALYLDLQMENIPKFLGRFFGQRSPNYFRFAELGYIAWVSPTFGIISVDSIRFSRVSFGCPDGAIGFFYHLGLNGIIRANATAFYEEEQEDESE